VALYNGQLVRKRTEPEHGITFGIVLESSDDITVKSIAFGTDSTERQYIIKSESALDIQVLNKNELIERLGIIWHHGFTKFVKTYLCLEVIGRQLDEYKS